MAIFYNYATFAPNTSPHIYILTLPNSIVICKNKTHICTKIIVNVAVHLSFSSLLESRIVITLNFSTFHDCLDHVPVECLIAFVLL